MRYLILFFVSLNAFAITIPPRPEGRVSDYAGVLSNDERLTVTSRLQQIESNTQAQAAIAIFPTIEDQQIEDFSNALFKTWKLGHKDKNDGVLLVLAMKERKMRVEVGYGLEGVIPDAMANTFIREDLKPNLKAGKVGQALMAYANHLERVLSKPVVSTTTIQQPIEEEDWNWIWWVLGGGIVLVLGGVGIYLYNEKKRQEERDEERKREREIEKRRQWRKRETTVAATPAPRKESHKKDDDEETRRRRRDDDSSSRSSSYSSSSSSSDSGWSGGGGDSGGGGASGDW